MRDVYNLLVAVSQGRRDRARQLITAGVDPTPALIPAVRRRDLEIVRDLLEAGADPNVTDETGTSALDHVRQVFTGERRREAEGLLRQHGMSAARPRVARDRGNWELPTGDSLSAWVSGHDRIEEYVYFCASTSPSGPVDDWKPAAPGTIRYRAYSVGSPPADWKPMREVDVVRAETGDPADEPASADVLCAAEALPAGEYQVDFQVLAGGREHEAGPVAFRVGKRRRRAPR
ncbi:MAG TPA: ankyrin repeat domain-containing protein [Gemmataceae bacterium]|nr:ankyrin repeat domain-containing protein [Gemmataceae bacterium]